MRINHNITALNSYRHLTQNLNQSSKMMEKLSSGLRINRASDDAAGLAISEKMRSQIRGLSKAEQNSLDGISLIQMADGALSSIHEMLQRARELAIQAGNDTLTEADKKMLQMEMEELKQGINEVANTTAFNGVYLLNVDRKPTMVTKTKTITTTETITQSNPSTSKIVTVEPGAANRVIAGYIEIPNPPTESTLEIEAMFGSITGASWPDLNIKSPNGEWFGYNEVFMNDDDLVEDTTNTSSSKSTYTGYDSSDEKMTFDNPISGKWYIEIRHDGGVSPTSFELKSNYLIYDEFSTEETIETTIVKTETITYEEEVFPEPLILQVGANKDEVFEIDLTDVRISALELEELSLALHESIEEAINKLDRAIRLVSTERSKWGAYQNALEHIVSNLSTSHLNLSAAESRIRDADMAMSMTEYTKNNIINQSAQAMLAQSNQLPQGILQLLKG